jgi:hypothetical protein
MRHCQPGRAVGLQRGLVSGEKLTEYFEPNVASWEGGVLRRVTGVLDCFHYFQSWFCCACCHEVRNTVRNWLADWMRLRVVFGHEALLKSFMLANS